MVSLFQQNLDDLSRFSQKPPMSTFTEIRPVEAGWMHAEKDKRGTSATKRTGSFRVYANTPTSCHLE